MTDEQFDLLMAEVRGIHATLRGRQASDVEVDLVAALAECFGPAPFTAAGVLMAAEEPGSQLGAALAELVDNTASTIVIGRLLARLPDLEPAGDRRGSRMFRLRGYPR
jgi:hypothetical protein